jgi:hypothetical protein
MEAWAGDIECKFDLVSLFSVFNHNNRFVMQYNQQNKSSADFVLFSLSFSGEAIFTLIFLLLRR